MFAKNNELNDNQKAYKEYYSKRLINLLIWEIFFIAIPLLNFILRSSISKVPVQLHYFIMVVIILCIIISAWCSLYWIGKLLKNVFSIKIAILADILFVLAVFFLSWAMYGQIATSIQIMSFYIPILLGIINFASEIISGIVVKTIILPDIASENTEDHTAIILAHDEKRALDIIDIPVPVLVNVLKKYGENFHIYFCLYEKQMAEVLTSDHIKRIWIFGHGTRGSCALTVKVFKYADFMQEKKDNGENLDEMKKMEYVYQCHCNPESTTPLTDYLLPYKGKLDPKIDDMPNYWDGSLKEMANDNSQKNRDLSDTVHTNISLEKNEKKHIKYMTFLSIISLVKRYEAHLEKKRELASIGTNDQSK